MKPPESQQKVPLLPPSKPPPPVPLFLFASHSTKERNEWKKEGWRKGDEVRGWGCKGGAGGLLGRGQNTGGVEVFSCVFVWDNSRPLGMWLVMEFSKALHHRSGCWDLHLSRRAGRLCHFCYVNHRNFYWWSVFLMPYFKWKILIWKLCNLVINTKFRSIVLLITIQIDITVHSYIYISQQCELIVYLFHLFVFILNLNVTICCIVHLQPTALNKHGKKLYTIIHHTNHAGKKCMLDKLKARIFVHKAKELTEL